MASVDIICMLSLFVISYLCIHIFCRSKKGHDLSKPVPGPFSLPIIGNLLEIFQAGYRTEELMLKWAKAYGRIFQFKMGPKTVYVLNDYELINEAWHHPEMQGRPTPDLTVKILGAGNGKSFLTIIFSFSGSLLNCQYSTVRYRKFISYLLFF